jgi:hypothetical protein
LRRVEAPDDYWVQVISSALADERLTFDDYRKVEHPYVEQWWGRHWDLADRLLDDPDFDHIRVATSSRPPKTPSAPSCWSSSA